MEIISKKDAIARGLKTYFTGCACKSGAIAERTTSSGKCLCNKCVEVDRARRRDQKNRAKAFNPDKYRRLKAAEMRRYRQRYKHTERYREYRKNAKHKRRAQTAYSDAGITREELQALRFRYGGKCAFCGAKGRTTIDHIVPLARGGAHKAKNIQFLCHSCNSSKGARAQEDFARSRGLLL